MNYKDLLSFINKSDKKNDFFFVYLQIIFKTKTYPQ